MNQFLTQCFKKVHSFPYFAITSPKNPIKFQKGGGVREERDTTTELWGLLEITATMAPELATSTDGNKSLDVKLDLPSCWCGKSSL